MGAATHNAMFTLTLKVTKCAGSDFENIWSVSGLRDVICKKFGAMQVAGRDLQKYGATQVAGRDLQKIWCYAGFWNSKIEKMTFC